MAQGEIEEPVTRQVGWPPVRDVARMRVRVCVYTVACVCVRVPDRMPAD